MSDAGASRLPDETSIPPDVYAAWRGSTLGRITEQLEVDLVLELAGPLEGKRVLDVGTGDGTYAIAAAGRHKRASVVGIDVSSAMVTAARRRADEAGVDLELRSGSAESLPFEGASFDLVLAVTLLCFVVDACDMHRTILLVEHDRRVALAIEATLFGVGAEVIGRATHLDGPWMLVDSDAPQLAVAIELACRAREERTRVPSSSSSARSTRCRASGPSSSTCAAPKHDPVNCALGDWEDPYYPGGSRYSERSPPPIS
jgi:SAM-dependent methyltransferase